MRFPRYETNTPKPTRNGSGDRGGRSHLHRVSAAIATGKRPAPFRTRKLSPSAPMVLPGRPGGRVGRRRTSLLGGGHPPLHASREGLGADDRHRLFARPRSGGCAFRAMVLGPVGPVVVRSFPP